jgi:WD40 repeat protein
MNKKGFLKAALFAVLLFTTFGIAVFAQEVDWRNFLRSTENSRDDFDMKRAQRRADAVANPLYRESFFVIRGVIPIKVADIPRVKKEYKDDALSELDRMISSDWRDLKIYTAQENYKFIPITAEDKTIDEMVKKVQAAGNDSNAVYKILTSPPVSEKLAGFIDPERLLTELRKAGVPSSEIIRFAMNLDNLSKVTDWSKQTTGDYKRIINYCHMFKDTPLLSDSAVIKKIADLGLFWDRENNYVLNKALDALLVGDLPNCNFMNTAQALAKLDAVGPQLQFTQISFDRGSVSGKASNSDKGRWQYRFGAALETAGINPTAYFNSLDIMGLEWAPGAMLLLAGQSNPALYKNVLTWDQETINKAKGLRRGRKEEFDTIKSLLAVTGKGIGNPAASQSNVNAVLNPPSATNQTNTPVTTRQTTTPAAPSQANTPTVERQASRTFTGHTGSVNSISFSPDGKQALSGSSDKTIKLWDVATGKEIRTFNGHTESVNSVCFSPDGKQALSGSWDKTIKLWDVATGKEIRIFTGHKGWVNSVNFSPDGKQALGSDTGAIKLWDIATGSEIRTFTGYINGINSVCFSPDGKQALSGSGYNEIMLRDIATGSVIMPFSGHTSGVRSVSFNPDGKLALSGSDDKTVKLWNITTGKEIRTFTGHQEFITSVAFSPDGKQVLSGSGDKTVKLWDVATGRQIINFTGHTNGISSVSFSPDGKQVLTGSYDKTVKLWNISQ